MIIYTVQKAPLESYLPKSENAVLNSFTFMLYQSDLEFPINDSNSSVNSQLVKSLPTCL